MRSKKKRNAYGRRPTGDSNVFGPPLYSLKYKDTKLYNELWDKYEAQCKLWEIIQTEPRTDEDIRIARETLEEYLFMKERWKRDAKKN